MRRVRCLRITVIGLGAAAALAGPVWADAGYEAVGSASWYGDKFHGRKTASGERYNMHLLTAAHPKLPMGTLLEVTNLENDKTIQVRVNDRGPYAHSRIIDVSREAAEQLGFRAKGIARVQIRYAGNGSTNGLRPSVDAGDAEVEGVEDTAPLPVIAPAAAAARIAADVATGSPAPAGDYMIQAGAFSKKENADRAAAILAEQGEVTIKPLVLRGLTLHRVLVGSWADAKSAKAALKSVAAAGFADAEVVSAP